jgi:hypothetical protein
MTPTDHDRETARMIEAVLLEWDQEREAAIRVAGRIATLLASRREGCSTAAADVLAERRRQVEAEGYNSTHDDQHEFGEIALAAVCYLLPEAERDIEPEGWDRTIGERFWPWDWKCWNPKDRRSDLVRGCALGIAEIERLDRASTQKENSHGI